MKKIISIIILLWSFAFISGASAHSGSTDADGCHYCQTNCEQQGYLTNTKHCHFIDTDNNGNDDGEETSWEKWQGIVAAATGFLALLVVVLLL